MVYDIKRSDKEAIIKVVLEGEAPYKFSLSPIITHANVLLVLPLMIKHERAKREKRAYRVKELKVIREERKAKKERTEFNGTENNEESALRLDVLEGTESTEKG